MAEELNSFFARFEANGQSVPPPAFTNTSLSLQEHQVRKVLREVNPRKAAGLDGVLGKVLRACADQLTGILRDFQYLPDPSHCTILLEICHHYSSPKNSNLQKPKLL